jgi:hypothetical protein
LLIVLIAALSIIGSDVTLTIVFVATIVVVVVIVIIPVLS